MCKSCWIEYGSPTTKTEATLAAVALIDAVYGESLVGGELHIMVDDWNLEDHHIAFCASHVKTDAEKACLAALTALPLAQRAVALALYDGFIT